MTSKILENYSYAGKAISHEDYDYIYLSPHLDDVSLSCSGTICNYKKQGLRILVATLFAGDPKPPFSPLAQTCHLLWQIPEDTPPYQIRKMEDKQAMSTLGVDYLWLNWPEVIYRLPDLSDFSDINDRTIDFHSDPLLPTLSQWLLDLHASYPSAKIVVPLGVGGHRDHRILSQTALNVLDHSSLLFFEDFPYAAYLPEETTELVKSYHLTPLEIDISQYLEQPIQAAACYKSQHTMLFYPSDSFGEVIKEYAHMGKQDRCIERHWKFA